MFDFLSSILGWLATLADYIISFFDSVSIAVVALSNSIALPLTLVGYMPVFIGSSITVIVAIMIVKFLIGR